jgi:hypothetical protein
MKKKKKSCLQGFAFFSQPSSAWPSSHQLVGGQLVIMVSISTRVLRARDPSTTSPPPPPPQNKFPCCPLTPQPNSCARAFALVSALSCYGKQDWNPGTGSGSTPFTISFPILGGLSLTFAFSLCRKDTQYLTLLTCWFQHENEAPPTASLIIKEALKGRCLPRDSYGFISVSHFLSSTTLAFALLDTSYKRLLSWLLFIDLQLSKCSPPGLSTALVFLRQGLAILNSFFFFFFLLRASCLQALLLLEPLHSPLL